MADFFDHNKYAALSDEDRSFLTRINAYSEKVLADIDPQNTPISFQLEKLKPVMQELANEKHMALEDVFIKYMDLASVVAAKQDQKLKEQLNEAGVNDFTV